MILRSKLFIVTAAALTIFSFILLSADCRNAAAQSASGKDSAGKKTATNQEPKNQSPDASVLVTFVEIGSVNCIPCKAMQPIMKTVEEEYKGQVKIVFHDVWTKQGKIDAMKYNIRVIPTQVFLDKNGDEYFRHEGFFPKDEVVRIIKMQGVSNDR